MDSLCLEDAMSGDFLSEYLADLPRWTQEQHRRFRAVVEGALRRTSGADVDDATQEVLLILDGLRRSDRARWRDLCGWSEARLRAYVAACARTALASSDERRRQRHALGQRVAEVLEGKLPPAGDLPATLLADDGRFSTARVREAVAALLSARGAPPRTRAALVSALMERYGAELGPAAPEPDGDAEDDRRRRIDAKEYAGELVKALDARERHALAAFEEGLSLAAIGRELGCKKSRAGEILEGARNTLARKLEARGASRASATVALRLLLARLSTELKRRT
jgi:DNA-directed RNA polymerase specialized sigma24 family protein